MRKHAQIDEIKQDRRREFGLVPKALLSLAVVAAIAITRELLLR